MKKIILFILVLISGITRGQDVATNATLDTFAILIGDQVGYEVMVSHPKGAKINDGDFPELDYIEFLNIPYDWDTIVSGNPVTLRKKMTLTSFEDGIHHVPPVRVGYTLASGEKGTVSTDSLRLQVFSIEVDTSQKKIKDIKNIIREPLAFRDFLVPILIFLVLVLLALILYFILRKKPEKKVVPEYVPPAHVIALEKLRELEKAKLWQQGKIKPYQSQLTFIIREYIEGRYKVPALESTTHEILTSLKDLNFSNELKSKLKDTLELADLVKFAKAEPPLERHDQLLKYAYDFVEQTRPAIQKTEMPQDN